LKKSFAADAAAFDRSATSTAMNVRSLSRVHSQEAQVLVVVRNRTSYRAGRSADGRAALGIAIARIVADGCAGSAADSRARERSAARQHGGGYGSREDRFQVGHVHAPLVPETNAWQICLFRCVYGRKLQ
jgi:hypothetical protein